MDDDQEFKVNPIIIKMQESRQKRKIRLVSTRSKDMLYYKDDIDTMEEDYDSQKLWCICNKPHDNRFMLKCDICEQWFHADCVNIQKSEVKQLEKEGIQWNCPSCSKKIESKKIKKPKIVEKYKKDDTVSRKSVKSKKSQTITDLQKNLNQNYSSEFSKKKVSNCKQTLSAKNSVCSDTSTATYSKVTSSSNLTKKENVNHENIIMNEADDNLKKKENYKKKNVYKTPTNTENKNSYTEDSGNTSQSLTKITTQPVITKVSEEDLRKNISRNLADVLTTRLENSNNITSSKEEITQIAAEIELEMYKFFKDTGTKYKAKYRSLVFNIKDTKNLSLFYKIASRLITPADVVKLSPEEMANQELAEWRNKETKHQLELIKKIELEKISSPNPVVVKTHKGEEIIENNNSFELIAFDASLQAINTTYSLKESKRHRSHRSHRSSRSYKNNSKHRSHSKHKVSKKKDKHNHRRKSNSTDKHKKHDKKKSDNSVENLKD